MAGRRKQQDNVVTPNSLVASAVQLHGTERGLRRMQREPNTWSGRAWGFYDSVGEYRFSVNWVGNILSRARLYAAYKNDEGMWEPRPNSLAQERVDQLVEGFDSQAQMLNRLGILLTTPGDSYLLGWTETGEDRWAVAAPSEVSWSNGNNDRLIYRMHGVEMPAGTTGIRVWRSHPKDARYADSPSRAVIPILSELDSLTKMVGAQLDSRLAGAGILWIPQEMDFPKPKADETGVQAFIRVLSEAMETAIKNREDPSSLVPIAVSGPGEFLDKIKHMTFYTPLDENAISLRQEAIRRLALGMDMPPEVLTGMGDLSHWNAWQVDEASIKIHAEPPLELIISSLTVGYLWPLLDSAEAEPRRWAILADTSKMRARQNRSREAIELNEAGKLADNAVLREVGFDETDAMNGEQYRRWLVSKVASGSATPAQVDAALRWFGVNLGLDSSELEDENMRESRPDPSLEDHPEEGPPERPDMSAVLCLAEPMVYRALERAGNKLRNKMQRKIPGVAAADTYQFVPVSTPTAEKLLEDAWEMVPKMCEGRGLDPEQLTSVLHAYCLALILEQKPHERETLTSFLTVMEPV